jgi:hypothetical protein
MCHETDIYKALREPLTELVKVYCDSKKASWWKQQAGAESSIIEQLIDEEKVTDTDSLKAALDNLKKNPANEHGALRNVKAIAHTGIHLPQNEEDGVIKKAGVVVMNGFIGFSAGPTWAAVASLQTAVEKVTFITPEMQTDVLLALLEKLTPATKIQHIIALLEICFHVKEDPNYSTKKGLNIIRGISEKHAPSTLTPKRRVLGTNFPFENAFYNFCLAAEQLIQNIARERVRQAEDKNEEDHRPENLQEGPEQRIKELETPLEALRITLNQSEEKQKQLAEQLQQKTTEIQEIEQKHQELEARLPEQQATHALEASLAGLRTEVSQLQKELEQERLKQTEQGVRSPHASSVATQGFFSDSGRQALHLKYTTGILLGLAAQSAAFIFYLGMIGTAYVSIPIAFALLSVCAGMKLCKVQSADLQSQHRHP